MRMYERHPLRSPLPIAPRFEPHDVARTCESARLKLFGELRERFAASTLPVTPEIALRWGALSAAAGKRGRPLLPIDGLLCATALEHGLTVVTRNEDDFAVTGVALLNPWS